jgi:Ca-activated chloride channel family protein
VVVLYLWLLRRKRRAAMRYASLQLFREAQGPGQRLRAHLPPALFLVALTLMLVAVARPAAVLTLPTRHQTVVLAVDVSGSMRATDVQPNRIAAAQAAARSFVDNLPGDTRVGVVAFATDNREDILAAIDRFQLQRGTAVGSGILVALKTIVPDVEFDLRQSNPRVEAPKGVSLDQAGKDGKAAFKPVSPGSNAAAAIILLSDGQTTTGPDPVESARLAADRGVRIYTVGVGTTAGELIGAEGWSMRVRLDEGTLKTIANLTLGEYFYAGTAADLRRVYETLNAKLDTEKRQA